MLLKMSSTSTPHWNKGTLLQSWNKSNSGGNEGNHFGHRLVSTLLLYLNNLTHKSQCRVKFVNIQMSLHMVQKYESHNLPFTQKTYTHSSQDMQTLWMPHKRKTGQQEGKRRTRKTRDRSANEGAVLLLTLTSHKALENFSFLFILHVFEQSGV